jgi:ribosome-binding factor A
MSKKYQRRVSDLVRSRLVALLTRKANDPRLEMVTITDVIVSRDTRHADVHYSVLGGSEVQAEAQSGLESASGWLRRELGQRLRLRNTPTLHFYYDPSLERGEHIASILDELDISGADETDGDENGDPGRDVESS